MYTVFNSDNFCIKGELIVKTSKTTMCASCFLAHWFTMRWHDETLPARG